MSIGAFMLVLTVGAALLALWLTVRAPRFSPQGVRGFVAAAVGCCVAVALTPALIQMVGRPLGSVAALFLVVLPVCTYMFLVTLWLLAKLSRLLRPF